MTDTTDPDWGKRAVARRNRRLWLFAGMVAVVSIAFGLGGRYLKLGLGPDAGSLLWAIGLLVAGAILIRLAWRDMDEIKRRIVINSAAIAGVASACMLVLAQAAGKMLPIDHPMLAIWFCTMGVMGTALVFQRLRG